MRRCPGLPKGYWGVSALLIAVGPYLALLLGALLLGYCRWLHPRPPWRRREQAALLRLPLIARLVSCGALSQTFRILTMTQRAGLTLVEGLNAAALAADHLLYRQALEQVQRQIADGEAFHHALGLQPLFPPLCRQLARVGEESGSLDALLDKLAQWYERQTHELADTLAQTLEPLLMLVVGGIVGALVIAMYPAYLSTGQRTGIKRG